MRTASDGRKHDPLLGYALVVAIGLGTVLLSPGVRLAAMWVAMMALGLVGLGLEGSSEGLALSGLARGALVGIVLGAPVGVFLFRPLHGFSERLYATSDPLLLFYQTSLVGALAEELFFRGVLQPKRGLLVATAAYAGIGLVYFAPHAPVLGIVLAVACMGLLGAVYAYVRQHYGLAAAVVCHALAAFLMNVMPSLITTWQGIL